jgi:hypothetical protein
MADQPDSEGRPEPESAAAQSRDPLEANEIKDDAEPVAGSSADGADSDEPDVVGAPASRSPSSPSSDPPPLRFAPAARPPSGGGAPLLISTIIGAIVGAAVATAAVLYFAAGPSVNPEVQSRLAALDKSAQTAALTAAAEDKRLDVVEASLKSAPDKASIAALAQRIATLETSGKGGDDQAALRNDVQAARADAAKAVALASRSTPATGAAPAPAFDSSALEGRIARLEAALAAPKSEARVNPEAAPSNRDAAAVAVVAEALAERVGSGAPFASEAGALQRLGADDARLAALKPFAETGAPTESALAASFAEARPAILAAAAPKPSDGVMDRLFANMSKVVRVTPVGEAAGDDPAALASRIAGALGRGQIAAALEVWDRLPEASRVASRQWADLAQARIAADAAAQSLVADAMANLVRAHN